MGMVCVFFFNDTATTEIYTLSLHDALPICECGGIADLERALDGTERLFQPAQHRRSEEHTSELQSQSNLVCRLLLEKKKNNSWISSLHLSSNVRDRNGLLSSYDARECICSS